MDRRVLLKQSALAAFLLPIARASAASNVDAMTEALDQSAKKLVTDGLTAGLSVGLSSPSAGEFARGYGFANLETGTLVNDRSIFRIASVTKQFAAAALLRLSDRGLLSPDDSLARYFPDFPNARQLTLHHLLSHISGIHDYVWGGLPKGASNDFAMQPEPHKLLAKMQPMFDFKPTTMYNYSNSNYLLIGEIIEKVASKSFAETLQDELLRPLGMVSTALDANNAIVPGRASGYALKDGKSGAFQNCDFTTLPFAAGAIRSTAADLLRWNNRLHSGKVLSADSYRRMTSAAKLRDGRLNGSGRYWPKGQTPGTPPAFVQQSDYGYGLEIARMFEKPVIWHSGGIAGFNSLLFWFPQSKTSIAILANTENGAVKQFENFIKIGTGA
jgi:D-alanyl-D-alanine carboxypeptidase